MGEDANKPAAANTNIDEGARDVIFLTLSWLYCLKLERLTGLKQGLGQVFTRHASGWDVAMSSDRRQIGLKVALATPLIMVSLPADGRVTGLDYVQYSGTGRGGGPELR